MNNNTLILTGLLSPEFIDWFYNNILTITATIGLLTAVVTIIIMGFLGNAKIRMSPFVPLYILAGILAYLLSELGQIIIPLINTEFSFFYTGFFAICSLAILAVPAMFHRE